MGRGLRDTRQDGKVTDSRGTSVPTDQNECRHRDCDSGTLLCSRFLKSHTYLLTLLPSLRDVYSDSHIVKLTSYNYFLKRVTIKRLTEPNGLMSIPEFRFLLPYFTRDVRIPSTVFENSSGRGVDVNVDGRDPLPSFFEGS